MILFVVIGYLVLRPDIVLSIADKLTFILLILLEYTDPCLEAEFVSSVTNTLASPHIVTSTG